VRCSNYKNIINQEQLSLKSKFWRLIIDPDSSDIFGNASGCGKYQRRQIGN